MGRKLVIQKLIGEGGCSKVFRATRRGRAFAVKMLRYGILREPKFVRRFELEASALERLKHPHIVRFRGKGDNLSSCSTFLDSVDPADRNFVDSPFIVMELLGNSLTDILKIRGFLRALEAIDIAIALAKALGFAHTRGIINRDLKPSNILFVSAPFIPKLIDFSVLKDLHGVDLDESGVAIGTPNYMSPEAILELPLDERSEIFQLGILLFDMLEGNPPFMKQTIMEIFRAVANTRHPDIKNTTAPQSLKDLIDEMLEKDPTKRPQTMEDVILRLQKIRMEIILQK